ncbi:hypothetical protein [Tuwongella immobilis]|uniref:Signal peptide-containing protein n=1 Tax=Tuwongella immobilis TaxID=692036 RepID=A0A6C2YR67_9BACT|nr:hypothetical protein [Tuwongella immobilis]VIP03894.1 Signal peptide-containing protein OS=Rhodopirellula sallentina SM41 GN=RSSM_04036 PE=4 SV=1 [Tuwongella immobilis]VTS05155.1 Signal peptide-containing protein OS=Rhodopirellula sallentina SM41 GN=RSSM_04036 PE=4 SV=1 [Tuwongella immobilis]
MFKKLAVYGTAGLIATGVISQTRLGSYVGTLFNQVTTGLQESVSPELELERIKFELSHLDQDIDHATTQLAEETTAIRLLNEEITATRERLEQSEVALRKRGEELKKGQVNVSIAGRTPSIDEATRLLREDVDRLGSQRRELANQERILSLRQNTQSLVAKQRETLVRQKAELTAAVAEMESDLKLVRLEQMESQYQSDDTRLADIKKSLKDLRRKVMVQKEKLNLVNQVEEQPTGGESVDEILGRLNGPAARE